MKKILITLLMLVISITTFAQNYFEYKPLYPSTPSIPNVPSTPSLPNYDPGLYVPSTNYGVQKAKPITQVVTGVYKSQNKWKAIRIKINIYQNDIRAIAYLNNGYWNSLGDLHVSKAIVVPEELKDAVEYEIVSALGDIYF